MKLDTTAKENKLNKLLSELNEMYHYGECWDGYEAIAPIPEIIEAAKTFAEILVDVIPENSDPKVMIDSSSGISFYFKDRTNKNYIEIFIYNYNEYGFFVDTNCEKLYGKEDISVEYLDEDLLNSIILMYKV